MDAFRCLTRFYKTCLIAALAPVCLTCNVQAGDSDKESVMGTWEYVAAEYKGEQLKVPQELYVTFADNNATFISNGVPIVVFSCRIELSSESMTVDTKYDTINQRGILSVDGDTLMWCLASEKDGRPMSFTTDKEGMRMLRTFKRVSKK